MLVAATVITDAKIRLDGYIIAKANEHFFGVGCSDRTWEQIGRMWFIINILDCNWKLTVDQTQCLLSKLNTC